MGRWSFSRGLSFNVAAGEMVAITGQSGAGKSSLLHLLAALDRPTSGEVWVDGVSLGRLMRGRVTNFVIGRWGMSGSSTT